MIEKECKQEEKKKDNFYSELLLLIRTKMQKNYKSKNNIQMYLFGIENAQELQAKTYFDTDKEREKQKQKRRYVSVCICTNGANTLGLSMDIFL